MNWIRVEDSLPIENDLVIACLSDKDVKAPVMVVYQTDRYGKGHFLDLYSVANGDVGIVDYSHLVTHWMKMPDLPNEVH